MEKIKSNYEIMKERMAERFLTYDQEGIIRKLSLRADEEYLYLTFLSFGYRVTGETAGSSGLTGRRAGGGKPSTMTP